MLVLLNYGALGFFMDEVWALLVDGEELWYFFDSRIFEELITRF